MKHQVVSVGQLICSNELSEMNVDTHVYMLGGEGSRKFWQYISRGMKLLPWEKLNRKLQHLHQTHLFI